MILTKVHSSKCFGPLSGHLECCIPAAHDFFEHKVQQKALLAILQGHDGAVLEDWELVQGVSFDTDGNRKKVEGDSTGHGTVFVGDVNGYVMLIGVQTPSSSSTTTQYTYLGIIDYSKLDGPLEKQTRIHFIQSSEREDA